MRVQPGIATPEEPHLSVEGASNFRDIGGYPARGGATRHRQLYRSDDLAGLTPRGRDTLNGLGVGFAVDLRTDEEAASFPHEHRAPGIVVYREPIFAGSVTSVLTTSITLEQLYLDILAESPHRLAATVRHIANSRDTAILVHCRAGKDRTGLAVALALLAVEVDEDAVLADYAATEANLTGAFEEQTVSQALQHGIELTPRIRELVLESPVAAMKTAIHQLHHEYGGASQYLLGNGLEKTNLAHLRTKLIQP